MRRALIAIVLLGCTQAAGAGVYSTTEVKGLAPALEKEGIKPLPPGLFRDAVAGHFGVLALQATLDSKQEPNQKIDANVTKNRQAAFDQAKALKAKVRSGGASLQDQVDLSALYIRLGKYSEAIELLEPLARGEGRSHFMVLANLGTVYLLAGQMERAGDYLEQARDAWPTEFPGLTPAQLKWYAEVEKYQLRLVRSRRLEGARGGGAGGQDVDPLFGERDAPVKFVGESGQYEAGTLAAKEKAKLPKDALAIVQQLVLWMPTDTRLYWLQGELLNAQGPSYIEDAFKILDDCGYIRGWHAPLLKEHRHTLQENLPKPAPASSDAGSWLPDTAKLVMVGGAAVLVIGLLGYFQVRELRRRRG